MVGAQAAAAENHGVIQRTDPKASSPAGVIYQIPLDSGRRDAAPISPADSRGKAPAGAAGLGSSSGGGSGPSAGGDASTGGPSSPGGPQNASATEGGGTPSNPSSIHSENGFGSSSQVPGLSRAALQTGAGVPAVSTAGSTLPTYLLVVLVVAGAIVAGLLSARSMRSRSKGTAEPSPER
jgi:hypothetical protein